MQAHLVGLGGEPGQIQAGGAALPGADGILPVEAGNKVAAGVAHHRHAQTPDHVHHVPAEAVFVGGGMAGLIDAAVDGAAQVLNEGAVDARVNLTDAVVLVQNHGRFFHGDVPPVEIMLCHGGMGHILALL